MNVNCLINEIIDSCKLVTCELRQMDEIGWQKAHNL